MVLEHNQLAPQPDLNRLSLDIKLRDNLGGARFAYLNKVEHFVSKASCTPEISIAPQQPGC